MKRKPKAWISTHKRAGIEHINKVPVQSIPPGDYEYTPLYSEDECERASLRLCLFVWFVAGAVSWELLRHLVMAAARAWL